MWKKADPSSLIPLWWEQHLTIFWAVTLTRARWANGNVSSLATHGPKSCSCAISSFIFFCYYSFISNVWGVIEQEMPQNKKQMETNVIRGSLLYFLSIKHQPGLGPLGLTVHWASNHNMSNLYFPLRGHNVTDLWCPLFIHQGYYSRLKLKWKLK